MYNAKPSQDESSQAHVIRGGENMLQQRQISMAEYSLNKGELLKLGQDNANAYQSAHPFPHIVLDNIFPPYILDLILSEFPSSADIDWTRFNDPYQRKLATRTEEQFGQSTRIFLHLLNSQIFLDFLEALTGIPNLISDPGFEGGGLHQILPGGFLKVHADFNKHERTKLDRRLNVLVYLNKNWKEEYGGHFELWDREMKRSELKILPVFNRMAIFSTTDFSFHGHPESLKCPDGMSRKSIATYYYTNGRPPEEIRPGLEQHATLFQTRPQEVDLVVRQTAKKVLKDWLPPIMFDALLKWRK
jgi:hypothetical protein